MKKIDSSKLEKLNKNELIHYIKNLHDNQDLGLNWEDKEEDVVTNLEQKLPILSEIKKSEIQNEKNNSSNLIIEGDNYYSLLNLNYTHEKKIDVIYIDPPYNTGKEFLYNDNIVDSVDEYRHSKWLSFMSKRLKLAKELLKDNGIIFIAIDDNEQAHLKLLCNEIFDEKNFVGDIVIVNNLKGRNDKLHIALAHERLLIFKKSLFQERGLKLSDEKIKEFDKKDKDGNPIRLLGLRKRGGADTRTSRPNLFFPLYISPKNGFVSTKKTTQSIQVFPKKSDGTDGCWRWGKNSVDLKHDMLLGKRSSTGKWDVFQIDYLHIDGHLRRSKPKSVWAGADYSSDSATKNFRKIMKDSKFTNPKSVELIKDIIDYSTGNESTILDFFAGSGTTGHAVLELNKEDGGNRKFILCTNDENNICTKVCYPRIKKVMNGYTDSKKKKIKGLGGNLKYFKIDFVDAKPNDANKKKLSDASTEMLCIKEDCFKELKSPKPKLFRIFTHPVILKLLFIIYDNDGIQPCIDMIKKVPPPDETNVAVYVHSLDESAAEDEFEEAGLENKVTLMPIPSGIIRMFERLSHG